MPIPNLSELAANMPRPKGLLELKIGDEWRAKPVDGDDVPEGVPVTHAWVVVLKDDRGYVTRPKGDEQWRVVEATVSGGDYEASIAEACKAQLNATVDRIVVTGYLDCKATSHNPDYKAGERTLRLFCLGIASKVDPADESSLYERRRLRTNEFMQNVRRRHREIESYLAKALDRYLIMRSKGEA